MSETGNLLLLNPPTVTSTVRSVGGKVETKKAKFTTVSSIFILRSCSYDNHICMQTGYRIISCSKPDDNVKLLIRALNFEVLISGVMN